MDVYTIRNHANYERKELIIAIDVDCRATQLTIVFVLVVAR